MVNDGRDRRRADTQAELLQKTARCTGQHVAQRTFRVPGQRGGRMRAHARNPERSSLTSATRRERREFYRVHRPGRGGGAVFRAEAPGHRRSASGPCWRDGVSTRRRSWRSLGDHAGLGHRRVAAPVSRVHRPADGRAATAPRAQQARADRRTPAVSPHGFLQSANSLGRHDLRHHQRHGQPLRRFHPGGDAGHRRAVSPRR